MYHISINKTLQQNIKVNRQKKNKCKQRQSEQIQEIQGYGYKNEQIFLNETNDEKRKRNVIHKQHKRQKSKPHIR